MGVSFVSRLVVTLGCCLAASCALSQNLPAIPPSDDPAFWGRANAPYALKLTTTHVRVNGNGTPLTHSTVANVFRDSAGRVCEQNFYDNGRPMSVGIRDPGKETFTLLKIVQKSAYVIPTPSPAAPPPGKGWAAERLGSRVIEGFPAEGFRFTRTIPPPRDGAGSGDTVIDEEWVSNTLGILLEQKTESQITGTVVKTVSHFSQVEPDATLFAIPNDYSAQQTGPPVQHP